MRALLLILMFASSAAAQCIDVACGIRVKATDTACFSFHGEPPEIIAATIRPLDGMSSDPLITLIAPDGTGVHPPVISGGDAATIRYVLPAAGTYKIVTINRGNYLFVLDCRTDLNPDIPRDCVRQELVNGERVRWELTREACRFTDPQRLASPLLLDIAPHDVVHVHLTSDDFRPRIGVYGYWQLEPFYIQDASLGAGSVDLTFNVPNPGRYWVMPTTTDEETTGRYELTITSGSSGCIAPIFVQQPEDVQVPYGTRATLSAAVSTSPALATWGWLDYYALPVQVGRDLTFVTPPVTATQRYALQVQTLCGEALSRVFTVSPGDSRRRTSAR